MRYSSLETKNILLAMSFYFIVELHYISLSENYWFSFTLQNEKDSFYFWYLKQNQLARLEEIMKVFLLMKSWNYKP